jgi:hypothetical protein
MWLAILLATGVFALNLSVQAIAASALLHLVPPIARRMTARHDFWGRVVALEATMVVLLATILIQVATWASVFLLLDQFPDFTTAFYHSAVNFTTLGYGDLVMSESTRLLGPLEAVNGAIMLGLSGATLFAAFGQLARRGRVNSEE